MNYKRIFITSVFALSLLMANAVNKHRFDFVVGVDGDFKAAKTAAEANRNGRFYIFFPNGEYNIGVQTGDANQRTTFSASQVSFIGQSMDKVVLYNASGTEGISVTATLDLQKNASYTYMQDITFQNRAYNNPNASANRFVVIRDQADKNIYKNVKMLSTQDTYYTPSGERRSYLETCEIHGTVDYICGGGDLYFNQCLLVMENRSNNCLTAPATKSQWGYVFQNCVIDGYPVNNGSYRLGRAWSNGPQAVFLNTRMRVQPTAAGWGDPMNVVPTLFAEFNSMDGNGNPIDLSGRRGYYEKNGSSTYINPRLSYEEAAKYTIENVLGRDGWRPDLATKQVDAPMITAKGYRLSWQDNDDALCYVVFRDGVYEANVTAPYYDIPAQTPMSASYTIRAANEYGGLGAPSNSVSPNDEPEEEYQEPEIPAHALLLYYGNGEVLPTDNADYTNLWRCTQEEVAGYSWAITGRDDKSVLYGNDITVAGVSRTTFKNSNGAQNTFYLPDSVKPTKITFIGYTNDEAEVGYLTEVDGNQLSLPFSTNTGKRNYLAQPSVVEYEFEEDVCGSFTFTFSTKQICFVFLLEVASSDCSSTQVDDVETVTTQGDDTYYDLSGRRVEQLLEGQVYIHRGRAVRIGK